MKKNKSGYIFFTKSCGQALNPSLPHVACLTKTTTFLPSPYVPSFKNPENIPRRNKGVARGACQNYYYFFIKIVYFKILKTYRISPKGYIINHQTLFFYQSVPLRTAFIFEKRNRWLWYPTMDGPCSLRDTG